MKHEIFWNIPRNIPKYIEIRKEFDGYCYICNKPIRNFSARCSGCTKDLIHNGNERTKLTFGDVGKSVINYQQYLHRSMFGCNVGVKYRGIKEERIRMKADTESVHIATKSIHNIILALKNEYTDMYKDITSKKKNIAKRILYNITLHYISYYYENSSIFKSEAHFMATMIRNIHATISSAYIRINTVRSMGISLNRTRLKYGVRYHYLLFGEVDRVFIKMGEKLFRLPPPYRTSHIPL